MNLISSFELLFFAVFGQTNTEHIIVDEIESQRQQIHIQTQPEWTIVLFKIVFGIYMMVSIIVLINLLIAMMSDTYQRIQAQSDIEWKYGLSKLIRKMHRTTTEPSPINLITTWLKWLVKACKGKFGKEKPGRILEATKYFGNQSPRSKAASKWMLATAKTQRLKAERRALEIASGLSVQRDEDMKYIGSSSDIKLARIDTVVDWRDVSFRYRALVGDLDEEEEMKDPSRYPKGSQISVIRE